MAPSSCRHAASLLFLLCVPQSRAIVNGPRGPIPLSYKGLLDRIWQRHEDPGQEMPKEGPSEKDLEDPGSEWRANAPIKIVESMHEVKNDPEGAETLPMMTLDDAVRYFKEQDRGLCISLMGKGMGGLSNTMGFVNTAMDYSLAHRAEFLIPDIKPPAHHLEGTFQNLFGQNEVVSSAQVPAWFATCPYSASHMPSPSWFPNSTARRMLIGSGCSMRDLTISGIGKTAMVPSKNCKALVVAVQSESSQLAWHFDYSLTRSALHERYWRALGEDKHTQLLDGGFPLNLSMHIRRGDVNGTGKGNFMPSGVYINMIGAVLERVDPRCINVQMMTDGNRTDPEVLAIREAWRSKNVTRIKVFDAETPAAVSFYKMTHSQILLGGPSGFPRLAAVLARSVAKFFIDDSRNSHPIFYLPRVSTIGSNASNDTSMLSDTLNVTLGVLGDACNAYLKAAGLDVANATEETDAIS